MKQFGNPPLSKRTPHLSTNPPISEQFFHDLLFVQISKRGGEETVTLGMEVIVQLKYLNIIWKSIDLALINCEIRLNLSFSKNTVISEIFNLPRH